MTALLLSSALAGTARGQVAAEQPSISSDASFSLEFSSGQGCPGEEALIAQIQARVPSARRVAPPAGLALRVQITDRGLSSLWIALPDGSSHREIRDATCEEATTSIALIASLVLDARPGERLHATELGGASAASAATAGATPAPAATPPAATPPAKPAAPAAPAQQGSTDQMSVRFGLSLAATLETGVAPSPPVGGLVGVSVLLARPSVWSPELRAELLVTTQATHTEDLGAVTLQLLAGRLSACPVHIPASGTLGLSACASFDAGSLRAEGASDATVSGLSNPMTWLAAGVSLRGEVRVSRSFQLELLAGVKGLINHDRFTLEPEGLPPVSVYDVPKVSLGIAAGGSLWL